jgi:hypothetical protein
MPLLAGPQTLDSPSTVPGACTYPAQPLGTSVTAIGVFYNKQPLIFAHAAIVPNPVAGIPVPPILVCVPGIRISVNKINKSVFVNKFPPLVQGDLCQAFGTNRPLTAPFLYPMLFVANSAK